MTRIHFIGIILIFLAAKAGAQNDLTDSLLKLEEKIFTTQNIAEKAQYLKIKTELNLNALNTEAAMHELERYSGLVEYNYADADILWNGALLSLRFDKAGQASNYFQSYYHRFDSSSAQSSLLGFLVYLNNDSTRAQHFYKKLILQDDSLRCLDCFYRMVNAHYRKGNFFKVSSLLVPGSGLIMTGRLVKGFIAMGIAGFFVAEGIVLLHNGLIINFLGTDVTWGLKFYIGQYLLTAKELGKKTGKKKSQRAQKCKLAFDKELKKYSIDYRLLR
jgi:hypothetical protein